MDEKRTGYISIGEMAKMNRTTVPTLRLYDSMNLLTPCYVDEKTCYRYYDLIKADLTEDDLIKLERNRKIFG